MLTKGQAFTNYGSQFYKNQTDKFYNYYTYSLPFSQIVSDSSIPSANILSGVYLNNSFLTKGQSGYVDFNFSKGEVYFSSPVTGTLSGNFAIKDFSIKTTDVPESNLLLETKFDIRPKISQTTTGIGGTSTIPAIYIKNNNNKLERFQLGAGNYCDKNNFSLYIFTDSLYSLDAAVGVLTDLTETYFPLLSTNEFPYNAFGGLNSTGYNYTDLITNKVSNNSGVFIDSIKKIGFGSLLLSEFRKINPSVFFSILDLQTSYYRNPH